MEYLFQIWIFWSTIHGFHQRLYAVSSMLFSEMFLEPCQRLKQELFCKINSGIYALIFSNKKPYLKTVDLLKFTEKTRNAKLHFLCSVIFSILFEKHVNTETIAYISIDVTSSLSLTVAICLRKVSHNHFFFSDDLIKLA